MFRINIYTMTDIKGPRRRDGFYTYVAEMPTEKGPATWGIYPKEIEGATENRAELTALTEALETIKKDSELDIYTESFHIASALKGMAGQRMEKCKRKRNIQQGLVAENGGITEWEHLPGTYRGTPFLCKGHEIRH